MNHPAIKEGRVALVTGGASGIGLAVAQKLRTQGMRIAIADRDEAALSEAAETMNGEVLTVLTDVSELAEVEALRDRVIDEYGEIGFLMNNAGRGFGGGAFSSLNGWQQVLGVNLWGVIHGLQTFTQLMIDQGTPCAIVNTGSKQGITNPPGDAAYNVSKAGVRSVTESLAHELRNIEGCQVTAHLLVPGFTYTGLIKRHIPEKPTGAWDPEQVADYLLKKMAMEKFYAICLDNDVSTELDNARILWNTNDIIEERPALSRWHPDYESEFNEFIREHAS
ncbi:MAG: SDR family NAD(P)-dependent oxidoreductase [Pseudomonadales bacterium]|jgi:NAD(P)-dependent dehydrogenase (short-subunit alcohol dehydrogenase family)|nr:SDR family NAD(P)-dependent oxidoreductase [Pseudomonadales bacterium]